MGEGRDLEDPERPIPEHGPSLAEGRLHRLQRRLADVDDVPRSRDLVGLEGLVLGASGDLLRDDHVHREDDLDALALGVGEDASGLLDHVVLGEALADGLALGQEERVRHAAAEDEDVDLREELVEDLELARDLRPADDRRKRPLGVLHELREHLDLALHQEPGIGRQELSDANRAGVGPMGRPERVVHVELGIVGQLSGELRVVLLLLGVEPEVLEEERLAVPEALHRVDRADPERIAGHRHVSVQEL